MPGYFRRASSISLGLMSSPVQSHPCRLRRPLNTPEPQPRSATRAPAAKWPSLTTDRIRRALLSGSNTSYESAAA